MNRRLRHGIWVLGTSAGAAFLGLLLALVIGTTAPEPRELYAAVSAHLEACRAENYPLAYHAAASPVQGRLSLGQFERKLRADYGPVRRVDRVEFGPPRACRGADDRAELDVYFVLNRRGEVIVRRYELLREEGYWKVDRSEAVAGSLDSGVRVRLTGRRA